MLNREKKSIECNAEVCNSSNWLGDAEKKPREEKAVELEATLWSYPAPLAKTPSALYLGSRRSMIDSLAFSRNPEAVSRPKVVHEPGESVPSSSPGLVRFMNLNTKGDVFPAIQKVESETELSSSEDRKEEEESWLTISLFSEDDKEPLDPVVGKAAAEVGPTDRISKDELGPLSTDVRMNIFGVFTDPVSSSMVPHNKSNKRIRYEEYQKFASKRFAFLSILDQNKVGKPFHPTVSSLDDFCNRNDAKDPSQTSFQSLLQSSKKFKKDEVFPITTMGAQRPQNFRLGNETMSKFLWSYANWSINLDLLKNAAFLGKENLGGTKETMQCLEGSGILLAVRSLSFCLSFSLLRIHGEVLQLAKGDLSPRAVEQWEAMIGEKEANANPKIDLLVPASLSRHFRNDLIAGEIICLGEPIFIFPGLRVILSSYCVTTSRIINDSITEQWETSVRYQMPFKRRLDEGNNIEVPTPFRRPTFDPLTRETTDEAKVLSSFDLPSNLNVLADEINNESVNQMDPIGSVFFTRGPVDDWNVSVDVLEELKRSKF